MITPGDAYNQSHHLLHHQPQQGFYQILIDVIEDHPLRSNYKKSSTNIKI